MKKDIQIVNPKKKNEISTTSYEAYKAVTSNPILANMINKSDSTIKRHLHELRNFGLFIAEMSDSEPKTMQQISDWKNVTAKTIDDYKQYLTFIRGMRTTSINQIIYIIRSYAKIAYNEDAISVEEITKVGNIKGISSNEAPRLDKRREKTADSNRHNIGGNVTKLTDEQIHMLKHDHPDTLKGRRNALLFNILLDHGLRISDAIGITVEEVDLNRRLLKIYTQKTGIVLNLQMTDDVYNAFQAYFEKYRPIRGSIWVGVSKADNPNGSFGKRSAQQEITKVAKEMGIYDLSAHDLRHCWTDRAIDGGSNLIAIQHAGGWKNINMVSHYATQKEISNKDINLG